MDQHPPPFSHFVSGLRKTRAVLFDRIARLLDLPRVDPHFLEELEEILITADLGMPTTQKLLDSLPRGMTEPKELLDLLERQVTAILSVPEGSILEASPHVVLTLGANGVGKTTTLGKLAFRATRQGK
ncbi:MAG: signal recognition particle receptor subunit alpha, partial [Candidatus Methylomirabilales bacterium]